MMATGLGGSATGSSAPPASPATSKGAGSADGRVGEAQPAGGFAGVLAGTQHSPAPPADSPSSSPGTGDANHAESTAREVGGAEVNDLNDGTALPEQFLTLLGGDWMPTPPSGALPSATGIAGEAADPLASIALDSATGQPAAGRVGAMPLPGLSTTTAAAPLPAVETAADGSDAFAKSLALADTMESGGDVLPAAGPDDDAASPAVFAPPSTQTTTARLAAAAAANEPITMPADPDAGLDEAFSSRIGWLADQRIGHAQIRVTPDHLGPIDVRLHLDGSRVSAEFNSASADVRHALEASLGRLRDMLGQQGLQLGHTDIGSGRHGSNGQGQDEGNRSTAGLIEAGTASESASLPAAAFMARRGLLDEYA